MSTNTIVTPTLPAQVHLHQGRWHVIAGNEVRRTFSGTDAARHAADMALFLNDPTLARLVAGFLHLCPALWKTAHRAADLVLRHHLTTPVAKARRMRNTVASVRSGTRSDTTYSLRENSNGTLSCTCPSFCEQPFYGPAGKPFCKHLLAYIFHRKLGQPLPPAPTPAHLWETLRTTLQARLQPGSWDKLFKDATLRPRSTLTTLRLAVPGKAVATLLNHPQWQSALSQTATTLCGYAVTVQVTARRVPALTLVPTPQTPAPRRVA